MIIRDKKVYVYDIEVFQNIFHCSVKNTETEEIYKFEISERKNQLRELVKFFKQVNKDITWGEYYTTTRQIESNIIFCGYNNLHYDNPIINYIIETLVFIFSIDSSYLSFFLSLFYLLIFIFFC